MKLKHIVIAVDSFKGSLSSMDAGKPLPKHAGSCFPPPASTFSRWQTAGRVRLMR